jgi:hypothetical protein
MSAPVFGIDFIVTSFTCPLCNKPIQFDDLVFVGKPTETPMDYWCFKQEILEYAKTIGLIHQATYDENNTPHIWFMNEKR